MAKSGSRGVVLLIVAMLVAALAYRFWPRGASAPAPTVSAAVTPPAADASVRAEPGKPAPPDAEPARPAVELGFHPGEWQLHAISVAGDKVLLHRPAAGGEPPAYRVISLPNGTAEGEVELTSYASAEPVMESGDLVVYEGTKPRPTDEQLLQAHLADHQKLWPLLREFPLGAAAGSAATADGKRGAFSHNFDHLYVIRAGKPFEVPLRAAYDPMILADGKTVVFRGYDGEFEGPGTGRYSLFWMNLDAGKPVKVPGTEGAMDNWALSRDGKSLRSVVAALPWVQPCLLEVPLVIPLKIGKKRCFEGDGSVQLSRHGDRAMWSLPLDRETDSTIGESIGEKPRPTRQRVRAIELERGSVPFDRAANGTFLISDGGRILLDDGETTYEVHDKQTREIELDRVTEYCKFLDDTTVVCPNLESVKTIDLTSVR